MGGVAEPHAEGGVRESSFPAPFQPSVLPPDAVNTTPNALWVLHSSIPLGGSHPAEAGDQLVP